jgi:hypothetical protein
MVPAFAAFLASSLYGSPLRLSITWSPTLHVACGLDRQQCSLSFHLAFTGYTLVPCAELFYWALTVGLLALVRWQDAILLVLPLSEFVHRVPSMNCRGTKLLSIALVACGCSGNLYTPNAHVEQCLWSRLDHATRQFLYAMVFSAIFLVLFSTRHGLFSWHPVVFIAVTRHRTAGEAKPAYWRCWSPVMFLLQLYINSGGGALVGS